MGRHLKFANRFRTDLVEELSPYSTQRCVVGFRSGTNAKKRGQTVIFRCRREPMYLPYTRRLQGFGRFVSPEHIISPTHVYGTCTFVLRPHKSLGTTHTHNLCSAGVVQNPYPRNNRYALLLSKLRYLVTGCHQGTIHLMIIVHLHIFVVVNSVHLNSEEHTGNRSSGMGMVLPRHQTQAILSGRENVHLVCGGVRWAKKKWFHLLIVVSVLIACVYTIAHGFRRQKDSLAMDFPKVIIACS